MGRLFSIFLLLLASVATSWAVSYQKDALYQSLAPAFPRVQWRFFDRAYAELPLAALTQDFIPHFQAYLQKRGLHGVDAGFGYRQYAELFKQEADLWLMRERHFSSQGACGVLITGQQALVNDPALPTGWILILSDEGWRVIDPVTFEVMTLAQWPYRETIDAVQF